MGLLRFCQRCLGFCDPTLGFCWLLMWVFGEDRRVAYVPVSCSFVTQNIVGKAAFFFRPCRGIKSDQSEQVWTIINRLHGPVYGDSTAKLTARKGEHATSWLHTSFTCFFVLLIFFFLWGVREEGRGGKGPLYCSSPAQCGLFGPDLFHVTLPFPQTSHWVSCWTLFWAPPKERTC